MISKILKLFLCCMLLSGLMAYPLFAATKTTKEKVKVTLVSATLISNSHVGNEWVTECYINDKVLEVGDTVELTLKPSDTLKLKARAEEQDKIPDIGTASATVKSAAITKSLTQSLEVTVVENRGRYSGNKAKWKFVFKLQKK